MLKGLLLYFYITFLVLLIPESIFAKVLSYGEDLRNYNDDYFFQALDSAQLLQAFDLIPTSLTFNGDWFTEGDNDMKINYFTQKQGFVRLNLLNSFSLLRKPHSRKQFLIQVYDGPYTDQGSMKFFLALENSVIKINLMNTTIMYKRLTLPILTIDNQTLNCEFDLSIYFLDTKTMQPLSLNLSLMPATLGIQILFESPFCDLQLTTSILTVKDALLGFQLLPYITLAFISVLANALGYFFLHRELRRKPQTVLDVSLPSLYFLATFDLFLFFDHVLTAGSLRSSIALSWFQGIGLGYITILLCITTVFVINVKFGISRLPWKDVTQKMLMTRNIFLVFNLFAFIFAFMPMIASMRARFYFIFSLFPLPHIIQNFLISKKHNWNCWYTLVLPMPKLLYFIYTEGCPFNLIRRTPNIQLCYEILAIISMQVIILAVQTRWPRFWFTRAQPYKIVSHVQSNSQNCPICLQDFHNNPTVKSPHEEGSRDITQFVITPCNHEFHLSCLKDWLKYKFECPYCRQALPFAHQFEDQQDESGRQIGYQ